MKLGYLGLLFFICSNLSASPVYFAADVGSGLILETENENDLVYPASLTKVMTLYLTFDALEKGFLHMNDLLPVSDYAAMQPRSNLSLCAGDVISVRDAILSVIIKSANDSAVVLAEALGGNEENFALMMTIKAKQLGLKNTTFKNATGLHNANQKTTATDMGLLTIAIKAHFPQYYPLFSAKEFSYAGNNYRTGNPTLTKYQGGEGLKTGFTRASGYNLISTAHRNGRTIVAVLMGYDTSEERNQKSEKILNKCFKKLSKYENKKYKTPLNHHLKIKKSNKRYNHIYEKSLNQAKLNALALKSTKTYSAKQGDLLK